MGCSKKSSEFLYMLVSNYLLGRIGYIFGRSNAHWSLWKGEIKGFYSQHPFWFSQTVFLSICCISLFLTFVILTDTILLSFPDPYSFSNEEDLGDTSFTFTLWSTLNQCAHSYMCFTGKKIGTHFLSIFFFQFPVTCTHSTTVFGVKFHCLAKIGYRS